MKSTDDTYPAEQVKNSAQQLALYLDNDRIAKVLSYESLVEELTQHVVFLLLNDMEKLLQLLYRVDVSEALVKQSFQLHDPGEVAPRIAALIAERELQKARTRLAFRNRKMT